MAATRLFVPYPQPHRRGPVHPWKASGSGRRLPDHASRSSPRTSTPARLLNAPRRVRLCHRHSPGRTSPRPARTNGPRARATSTMGAHHRHRHHQVEGLASSTASAYHPRQGTCLRSRSWLLCDANTVLEGVGRVCAFLAVAPTEASSTPSTTPARRPPPSHVRRLIAQRSNRPAICASLENLTSEIGHLRRRLAHPPVNSDVGTAVEGTPRSPRAETAEPASPESQLRLSRL